MLAWASAHAAAVYNVGIVPHGGVKELREKWKPLIDWISVRSGVPLSLDESVGEDENVFYAKYRAGEYDFALINPKAFATLAPAGQYRSFARADGMLQGLLAVAAHSDYKSLMDLNGKRVIFPTKGSYAATTLNEQDFAAAGVSVKEEFAGNHEKAYRAVAEGRADAVGGVMKAFAQLPPDVSAKLRIIHTTVPCPPHPFVAGKRVPENALKSVAAAFLALDGDPVGRKLLKGIATGKIVAASDAEYASLRP